MQDIVSLNSMLASCSFQPSQAYLVRFCLSLLRVDMLMVDRGILQPAFATKDFLFPVGHLAEAMDKRKLKKAPAGIKKVHGPKKAVIPLFDCC